MLILRAKGRLRRGARREPTHHSATAASSIKAAISFAWERAVLAATSSVRACIRAANSFWTSGAMTLSSVVIT